MQSISFHCNVSSNEAADSLAKEGATKEQVDRSASYPEMETILNAKQHSKWRYQRPWYNKADPYYVLTRQKQMTVFRTGHKRLNYHLYCKLCIGHAEQCPCGTGSQTTERLLQSCPSYSKRDIWPDHTPVAHKLYGSLGDLQCTATFVEEIEAFIRRRRRRRRRRRWRRRRRRRRRRRTTTTTTKNKNKNKNKVADKMACSSTVGRKGRHATRKLNLHAPKTDNGTSTRLCPAETQQGVNWTS